MSTQNLASASKLTIVVLVVCYGLLVAWPQRKASAQQAHRGSVMDIGVAYGNRTVSRDLTLQQIDTYPSAQPPVFAAHVGGMDDEWRRTRQYHRIINRSLIFAFHFDADWYGNSKPPNGIDVDIARLNSCVLSCSDWPHAVGCIHRPYVKNGTSRS